MNKMQRLKRRSKGNPAFQERALPEAQPVAQSFPAPNPHRYEISMIDSYIQSQSLVKIFTSNGFQEKGKIRAHDPKVLVLVHDPHDGICIMYKQALSTIEKCAKTRPAAVENENFDFEAILPDSYSPSIINENIEEHWLSKFINSHSHVTLVTIGGYQEHGIILAHDENVIVFIRYKGDSPNVIYKNALSTIYMKY